MTFQTLIFFCAQITQKMHDVGKAHQLTRIDYPDAGHLIEPPFSPHFRATNFMVKDKYKGGFTSERCATDIFDRKIIYPSVFLFHCWCSHCPVGRTNQASLRCSGGFLEEDTRFLSAASLQHYLSQSKTVSDHVSWAQINHSYTTLLTTCVIMTPAHTYITHWG